MDHAQREVHELKTTRLPLWSVLVLPLNVAIPGAESSSAKRALTTVRPVTVVLGTVPHVAVPYLKGDGVTLFHEASAALIAVRWELAKADEPSTVTLDELHIHSGTRRVE